MGAVRGRGCGLSVDRRRRTGWLGAVPSTDLPPTTYHHGISTDRWAAALRVRCGQPAQAWGATTRRPRFWQSRHPQRPVCGHKLVEAAQNRNHRYSTSRGCPTCDGRSPSGTGAVSGWTSTRYPGDKHHRGQRGAGPSDVDPGAAGRSRPRPRPELPDSHLRPVLAGGGAAVPYSRTPISSPGWRRHLGSWPRPRVILTSFPTTPPPPASSRLLRASRRLRQRARGLPHP